MLVAALVAEVAEAMRDCSVVKQWGRKTYGTSVECRRSRIDNLGGFQ